MLNCSGVFFSLKTRAIYETAKTNAGEASRAIYETAKANAGEALGFSGNIRSSDVIVMHWVNGVAGGLFKAFGDIPSLHFVFLTCIALNDTTTSRKLQSDFLLRN